MGQGRGARRLYTRECTTRVHGMSVLRRALSRQPLRGRGNGERRGRFIRFKGILKSLCTRVYQGLRARVHMYTRVERNGR